MINLRRLKGLRVEHDLTQEEFASWIGMPISTYRKKELGVSPIQLEEAYKISQLLGESIEDIFFKNKVPKQE
ncbi:MULTISPECIES: helix-turn-helix transcriptional regulator [unclassified Clostridium]|uniref:helix-turn-helix transcriptional regulator n=2 Tax=Clostridium TaxID=1485 RepID=UPI001C8C2E84|nr:MULTISPECIES: helix-turn-helix domain-containing protein [unclassified Clostridium]MBX9136644.1 helix-turn-helix domain-containing protein [Clostridium sp. K12(2020)]MBX9144838.1 helix-turn-helix domain-containing protein [Clostridium sp. K13]